MKIKINRDYLYNIKDVLITNDIIITFLYLLDYLIIFYNSLHATFHFRYNLIPNFFSQHLSKISLIHFFHKTMTQETYPNIILIIFSIIYSIIVIFFVIYKWSIPRVKIFRNKYVLIFVSNFYELIVFRFFEVIHLDVCVNIFFKSTLFFSLCSLLFIFCSFLIFFMHINNTYLYINLYPYRVLHFDNRIIRNTDLTYFVLKVLIALYVNTPKGNQIKTFIGFGIMFLNVFLSVVQTYLLIHNKFVYLSKTYNTYLCYGGNIITVSFIIYILWDNIQTGLKFLYLLVNVVLISMCIVYQIKKWSHNKMINENNQLGRLIYLIYEQGELVRLTKSDISERESSIVYKIIKSHDDNCKLDSHSCNFCKAVNNSKEVVHNFKDLCILVYKHLLYRDMCDKSKINKEMRCYYYIIKLYVCYLQTQKTSLVRVVVKYNKILQKLKPKLEFAENGNSMDNKNKKQLRLNHYQVNNSYTLKLSFELMYIAIMKHIFKEGEFQKVNNLIQVDPMIKNIKDFIIHLQSFFEKKIINPISIWLLSSRYSKLIKTVNFSFLTDKENKLTYICALCGYCMEELFNDKISKHVMFRESIILMDESLDYNYRTDSTMLLLYDVFESLIIVKQGGKEVQESLDKQVEMIFPPLLRKEGKKRLLKTLLRSNTNLFEFYYYDIPKDSVELFKMKYVGVPCLDDNKNLIYIILKYKIEREPIIILENKEENLENSNILTLVSNAASNILKITNSILAESFETRHYLRDRDMLQQGTMNINFTNIKLYLEGIKGQKQLKIKTKKKYHLQFLEKVENYKVYIIKEGIISKKPGILSKITYSKIPYKSTKKLGTKKEKINPYHKTTTSFDKHTHTVYYEDYLFDKNKSDVNIKESLYYESSSSSKIGVQEMLTQTGISSNTYTKTSNQFFDHKKKLLRNKDNNEGYSTFFRLTLFIVAFNLLIIILISIFFVIQIFQSFKLKNIYDIVLNYNSFQNLFYYTSLSIFSLGCKAHSNSEIKCINYYYEYSKNFSSLYSLPSELLISDFILKELSVKSEAIMELLKQWEQDYSTLKSEELKGILTKEFVFYSIEEFNQTINIIEQKFPLEEAVKKFVNIINLVISSPDFMTCPVYTITIEEGKIDMSIIEKVYFSGIQTNEVLTNSQKFFYVLVINYQRYILRMMSISESLEQHFEKIINQKRLEIFIYLLVLALLHVLMMIISFIFICKSKRLHMEFYYNVYVQLSNNDFIEYYLKKISFIFELLSLYKIHPNEGIFNINKLKQRHYSCIQEHKKVEETNNLIIQIDQNQKEIQKTNLFRLINPIYNTKLLPRYLVYVSLLFFSYFIFCILFFFLIQFNINDISKMNTYFNNNYLVSNNLVLSLGLIQIMSLTNQTDQMFYEYFLIEKEGNISSVETSQVQSANKAFIGNLLDSILKIIYKVEIFYHEDSIYKPLFKVLDFNCDSLFPQLNDTLIDPVITKYPKQDFYKLLSAYCKTLYTIEGFSTENFLYSRVVRDIGKILNLFKERTWEVYAYINKQSILYKLYTDLICFIRPLRKQLFLFLTENILTKLLWNYQLGYILFLLFNILYELFILIFMKYFIMNKIVQYMKDIIILGKSLECL